MTARTWLLLAATGLMAALAAHWRFSRSANTLASALRDARREVARLEGEFAQARRNEVQRASPSAIPRSATLRQTVNQGPSSEAAFQEMARKRSEARNDALFASPDLQLLFAESRRASYRVQFAALFHKLNLTHAQRETYCNALVAWDVKASDLEAIQKQQRLAGNDPGLKAQRAEAEAALMREVMSVLGPEGVKITREYTRLDQVRAYLAGYGGLFSRLGQPLTFEQFEALTDAFGSVSPKGSPEPSRFTTAQWDAIAETAQGILTPDQWSLFSSTTPPGEFSGRWDAAVTEALAKIAAPKDAR